MEVFVETFPAPGDPQTISQDGGYFPRWRPDGTELYYYAFDEQLMVAKVSDAARLDLGAATPLFRVAMLNGPVAGVGFGPQYDVSRDGQRFLVNLPVESGAPPSITVLLNWVSALRARGTR